jgi:HD-GYP domain-containing protein (c-di-GMP phosphodiesterase class II)
MSLQALKRVLAVFRHNEQPEWFAHIYPHGHATARLARRFAATCLDVAGGPTLDEIEFGAHVHDIGKYVISKAILLKPGPLDEEERAIMSLHPAYGVRILAGLPHLTPHIIHMVLYHHERWDGAGYPEGLSGRRIPLAARIVAVADVYTSLRARRSYKPTRTRAEAYAILEEMAGRELDPDLVDEFLRFARGQTPATDFWPYAVRGGPA